MFVTGGSGLLGRAIVRELIRSGTAVRSFQRHPGAGDEPAFAGDVRDPAAVAAAVGGASVVIHAAGLAHVFRDVETAPFAEVNEGGTDVVARAAAAAGVRHFVHVSSVSVYGGSENGGHEDAVCSPAGAYAISKAAAEERVIDAAKGSTMRVTILRLATLYGEGDRGNVQRLLQLIDSGRFVWLGTGTNRKSLVHVDDAARACVLPIDLGGGAVETFNVCAPPVTMRNVVEELACALDRPLPRWHIPAPVASVLTAGASLLAPSIGQSLKKWTSEDVYPAEKFARRFNFSTDVSLQEGIARQVAGWRARRGGSGHA